MEIQIAVSKTNKYNSPESGDTLEVVERPNGGVSVVLADGQDSGHDARLVSALVVHKVINLLADGVRDGAAARAASDQLFTERNGQASAWLNILSADFQTGTIVMTRNNSTPIFIAQGDQIECLSGESTAVGLKRNIHPTISEVTLEPGITIVAFSDGVAHAGKELGLAVDVCTSLKALLEEQNPSTQEISDIILGEAIRLDQGRPNDDMSVVVMRVLLKHTDDIRRLSVRLPINELHPLA